MCLVLAFIESMICSLSEMASVSVTGRGVPDQTLSLGMSARVFPDEISPRIMDSVGPLPSVVSVI